MPRNDAIVITATSLCATWDISCARTPSSSTGSSRRRMPVVQHTTARFWLRPVAKALGTSVSAMATRGFGMSDIAHRRSTTPCSSGASAGLTSWACIANSVILSEKKYCASKNSPAMTTMASQYFGTTTKKTTMKTTYSRPSANIVLSMRVVRPLSGANLVRAAIFNLCPYRCSQAIAAATAPI